MAAKIETTELIQVNNYDPKKCMIFSKPINKKVSGSKKKIEYKTINISSENENGSKGHLLIPTGRLFSFGISENKFSETKNGYSFPLCLWSRDGVTKDEKIWIEKFNEIVDCCINHLLQNKEEIGNDDLTKKDLFKVKGGFNPLYWKKDCVETGKGKTKLIIDNTKGPILYTKVEYSKKNDEFFTTFYDKDDKEIDADSLIGKCCFAESSIKIESIYIGNNISLQVKLNDATIEFLPAKTKNRRFMKKQKSNPKVQVEKSDDKSSDEEE